MPEVIAIAALVAVLSACGGGDKTAPAPNPLADNANAPAPSASATPLADGAALAAEAAKLDLPPECQAYFQRVAACIDQVGDGASKAVIAGYKVQLRGLIAGWPKIENKDELLKSCKVINTNFNPVAQQVGCTGPSQ
jgi:hypothetical protein